MHFKKKGNFPFLLPRNRNKTRRIFLLTVLWTTLVSDDSIPIALPTAADPSPAALSVSLLASPAGGQTNTTDTVTQGSHNMEKIHDVG